MFFIYIYSSFFMLVNNNTNVSNDSFGDMINFKFNERL